VKVRVLLKCRKKKRIVKERIYIGFDFCKGDAINGFERGLIAKWER